MNNIEQLLDATLPFVESLLSKYGEFFPLASAVQVDNEVAFIATEMEKEQPDSELVIADLKISLIKGVKNEGYKAIAIFYDAMITDPDTSEKSDAIAVIAESIEEADAFIYYFPYTISKKNEVEIEEGFINISEKEIYQ